MLEKGFGESLFLEHNINLSLFGFQHYLECLLLKLCWRHTQYPENETTSCNLKMGSMTPEAVGSFTATQEVPRQIGLDSRGSTRFPPTSSRDPFPPPSSRVGILSLRGRERIPGVPVASQEEALSTGKARGTPGLCHHSQSRPDVSVHSRETCFPCTVPTF